MFRMLVLLLFVSAANAQTPLKVKTSPGVHALPIIAAVSRGFFERQGLKVEVLFTGSSQELRDGLAAGEFQVAQFAADNAVAMAAVAGHDVVIVAGGDDGMNALFVQPGITSLAELRGQTVIVDAPDTAYALLLKKILLAQGMRAGADYKLVSAGGTSRRVRAMLENREYKASMMNPPFTLEAEAGGLKNLGRAVDFVGPYLGRGSFAMRNWAAANSETLERYLAGFIEGTRWVLAAENRAAATALLVERLKVAPPLAPRTWEVLADPRSGLARDARLDMQGFRNLLALRAEIEGTWAGKAPPPERYVDLKYYEGALRRIAR
jgi:ABC-type nitrate/sulfonate/bicarbonate transport system substrate-binding protein